MNHSEWIDLRSDTVTKPTPAMRRAMAEADVGDDVYAEDPTVNLLERRAAEILGKEAALFVPTGTMGNTIAVKLNTRHGQEVICEARSHVYNYELSMMAWFSGCLARPVPSEDGVLRWEDIQKEIRPLSPYRADTGLIVIENTHNMAGGTVTPIETMRDVCRRAHEMGLRVHLDGARIFNAATYLKCDVRELVADADTVMFCLSKGLCAPVGSLVAGTAEAMARARLYRKRLGGGMRQAGVLAAAGLIALNEMPQRLAEDHSNARFLAEHLGRVPGIRIPHRVETNIVIFDVAETGLAAAEFSQRLKAKGVLCNPVDGVSLRLLTHHDVSRQDCERAAEAIEAVARRL
jgi:threonine aldolase